MKKNTSVKRKIAVIAGIVAVVLALGVFFVYQYASVAYEGGQVRVNIPKSATVSSVRDSLVSSLGEGYGARVFKIWEKLGGEKTLAAGSYRVDAGEVAWKLARRIKNRRQDPVTLTFNNVRTMNDLSLIVDSRLEISSDEFLASVDSILSGEGVKKNAYPAYFLPDTYEFYWTDSPEKVTSKILANHDRFWTSSRIEKARELGLTPVEVSTLASIVEEETNKADERPKVARLYLNRLERGMKLQADPTVKFAVGDFSLKRILSWHLAVKSPYNTYMYEGLPPGPIRLPSAATLDVVLNAPAHDYVYMCAREDFSGYHNFAADYASHQQNARRYRAALDKNGIK